MRAPIIALFAALSLALFGCGGTERQPAQAGQGKTVSGYGLRVNLPSGWTGRVFQPSPNDAIELEAATSPLLPRGQFLTGDELGAGNAYVIIDDFGQARRGFVKRANGWQVHPRLPLTLSRPDLRGPYEGGFPSGATLPVGIEGRALEIRIRFGSRPSVGQLGEVNDVLGSLSVAAPGTTSASATASRTANTRDAPVLRIGTAPTANVATAGLRRCPSSTPHPRGPNGSGWNARVSGIDCGTVGRFIFNRFLGDGLQAQFSTTRDQNVRLGHVNCDLHPQPAGWRVGCARGAQQFVFLLRS